LVKQDPSPELVDEYYFPSSQDTVGPKQPNETPSSSSRSSNGGNGASGGGEATANDTRHRRLRFGRDEGGDGTTDTDGLEGEVCKDWAYANEKHYPFYSADAADGDSGHKYKLYKLGHPVMDCYDMYGRRTLLPFYLCTSKRLKPGYNDEVIAFVECSARTRGRRPCPGTACPPAALVRFLLR
jgi:hypothetical protein